MSQMYFSCDTLNNRHKPKHERILDAIERNETRNKFYVLLWKLSYIAEKSGIKLIIENPATKPNYLIDTQNFLKPTFIDNNRMLRGDYFRKPTAYWFFNLEPTQGFSEQNDKEQRIVNNARPAKTAGLCSEERSMISPDYARNFICDFILGKKQEGLLQSELF